MFIFLYGDNILKLSEKSKALKKRFIEKNRENFVLEEFSFKYEENKDLIKEIKDEISNTPLFGAKKLIVIDNLEELKERQRERLLEILKIRNLKEDKNIFLLLKYKKYPEKKDKNLVSSLKKISNFYQDFLLPKNYKEKIGFIKKYIRKYGFFAEDNLLYYFYTIYQGDLLFFLQELKKVSPYFKLNKKNKINIEDIEIFFNKKTEIDFWEFTDFILSKNAKKTFELFDIFFEKYSVFEILGYLKKVFEKLILIELKKSQGFKEREIINSLKLNFFYFKKLKNFSRNYSIKKLYKIYSEILNLEVELKSGIFKNHKLGFLRFLLNELFIQ